MNDDASGEHAWLMPSQPKTRDLPRRAHEISRAGRYVWQVAYFIIEADRGRDVQCMVEGQSVIRARRAGCGTSSPKDSGPGARKEEAVDRCSLETHLHLFRSGRLRIHPSTALFRPSLLGCTTLECLCLSRRQRTIFI
jgi:hypothetical protein